MAYTTETKVNALFGITIPTAVFTDLLAAVKLFIDGYTGKTFEGASADQYYDGNGIDVLNVNSFYGTPTIAILDSNGNVDSTLGAGDFLTAPYNSAEKNQIILTHNGSVGHFPNRLRSVKITATFGSIATVPADISLAATKLIGATYNQAVDLGSTTGDIKSEKLGDYEIVYQSLTGAEAQAQLAKQSEALGVYELLDLHRDIDI